MKNLNISFITLILLAGTRASAGLTTGALVTGWDFSQYDNTGVTMIGSEVVDTLSANYSDFASSEFGAGPSAAFSGTLYYDGSFGSSSGSVVPFLVRATSTNLTSNVDVSRDTISNPNLVPFNSLQTLLDEGQSNANPFGLQIFGADTSLVFRSTPSFGLEYSAFSFAGMSLGDDVSVDVETSVDGVNFFNEGSFILTDTDSAYQLDIDSFANEVFVRMTFDTALNSVVIDNVAFISYIIPEPSTYALIVATGIFGVILLRRKRA
ncbi:PEP-CTERM sorting domain-containing protein [Cerasicoccus frondis]|uniref:PEP-CTERM sorting domain-containing protein n=1 Tax=Cerasicoccus frondis TaxID=490090 RepID=UPI0028524E1F|nr:PEP-CTERM sorting domain-containing protein [Cerasicoccus frondis]